MTRETYRFSNGVSLYRRAMLDIQIARYQEQGNTNLHEPEEEVWLERLLDGCGTTAPVFIDVGAGVGYYSILVKQRFPAARVVAVDALPAHAEVIAIHATLNGLANGAIELVTEAVAARTGEAEFVAMHYGSHLAAGDQAGNASLIKVRTITLAALLDRIGTAADVLKIDIQGSELDVLAACPALLADARVKALIVGTHGPALFAGVRELLSTDYDIIHQNPAPEFQPDGLIVARHRRTRATI